MFYIENGACGIGSSGTGRHKRIPVYYGLWIKVFKNIFEHGYIALNIMKSTCIIQISNNMFSIKLEWTIWYVRVQDHNRILNTFFFEILKNVVEHAHFIDNIQASVLK